MSKLKILTGSTGIAVQDMTPRGSFLGLATGVTLAVCLLFDADATVTGLATGIAANGAFLALCGFDALIKPRL